ncbi:pentapeptide repeat-containing protein [Phycobacter sp. K97]|uniref:pentapeptide repeat-containing protein n=1 Tax=Phycobacter sedimenti TaxID=3133977 RepID=UPI00311E5B14
MSLLCFKPVKGAGRLMVGTVFLAFGSAASAQSDYSGQTLTDINFLGQDLSGADFTGATLAGVVFDQANLTDATFDNSTISASDLGATSFDLANLTDANFTDARLTTLVSFQYATLTGANFSGIDKTKADFGPTLDYDASVSGPIFSDMRMDCEFPWLFQYLDLQNAEVPDCENLGAAIDPAELQRLSPLAPQETNTPVGDQAAGADNFAFASPMARARLAAGRVGSASTAASAIYVSPQGTDSATCGATYASACLTVGEGIARCAASGGTCDVLIDYGKYTLSATLALADKVNLVGGYVQGQPSSSYQSTIIAPTGGAPAISGGSGITSNLSNLIVIGTPSTSANDASVTMQFISMTGLTMANVNVQAGTGTDAANQTGAGAGTDGAAGSGVTAGANKCTASDAAGGAGAPGYALNTSCSGNWASGCSYHCSQNGPGNWGNGGSYGQAGGGAPQGNSKLACYFGGSHGTAGSGGNGVTGASASQQAAASSNRVGSFDVATGAWTPSPGAGGQRGNDGGGGGGGEASSPNISEHCKFLSSCGVGSGSGGTGGGGGSGGCGADGGVGGPMGGGTFAIVLINTDLTVTSKLKVTGAQGGSGGDGGAGAKGGTGGAGGTGSSGGANGGPGGKGGDGGASGGGAGGNGGPSVGIVLVGTSKYTQAPTSIYPGASGAAGTGGAGYGTTPTGAPGQSGLAQASYQAN